MASDEVQTILELTGNRKRIPISEEQEDIFKKRSLPNKQLQVATLTCFGMTNMQIAEVLNISVKTVEVYLKRIKDKLGFHQNSRTDLQMIFLKYALEHRILSSEDI